MVSASGEFVFLLLRVARLFCFFTSNVLVVVSVAVFVFVLPCCCVSCVGALVLLCARCFRSVLPSEVAVHVFAFLRF